MFSFFAGLFGFVGKILAAIPMRVYAMACIAALLIYGQYALVSHARTAGDTAARREIAPLLMQAQADAATRLAQASDALGKAKAFEDGLSACIGTRVLMDSITASTLAQRQAERQSAARALEQMRSKLANAYAIAADGCAGQPVPAGVLRLLDNLDAGEADTDAGSGRAGAEVRAGAAGPDHGYPYTGTQWLDVVEHDGLDSHGLGTCTAQLQCGQGGDREAVGTITAAVTPHASRALRMMGPSPGRGGLRVRMTAVAHDSPDFSG